MADDNVVALPVITTLDIPVDRILDRAKAAGLKTVVVIGEFEDGERYFASSIAGGPDVLWMLAKAQRDLLAIGEDET